MKKVGKITRPYRYDLNQIPYTEEVRNRFKGLDLIDRVPDELWTEVCDIVQENRDQDHPHGKEMQKSKMAVWGGLTNSCEKKRSKKQRRKGISDQCKEIEENNRMGKTRALFKKIRDTKGTFHEKMGSIKDRNGVHLMEAEDIKKRWQKYTEELYKKELHDPDNHDGVITHLEPDIL